MRLTLVDEICTNGRLEPYRLILEDILFRIHNDGCTVNTRYDIEPSNFEDYREHSPNIRISLKNVQHPLNIIWRLLHEYGHYLSGPRKAEDQAMQREELAWGHADEIVKLYPDLVLKFKDYEKCKENDLNSYRKFFQKNRVIYPLN